MVGLAVDVFEYIVLGLMFLYTIYAIIKKEDSNSPILIAIFLLIISGLLVIMKLEELADRVAILVFYLLCVGVALKAVEVWREESKPSEKPNRGRGRKNKGENEKIDEQSQNPSGAGA